jgi:haloacetate dehalogenase
MIQAPNPESVSYQQALAHYFPSFKPFQIATSGATICGVTGGSGPALLLLHGWPQSLLEWHRIAPLLARHFTVVAGDLRGYGGSSKPESTKDHAVHSKRAMALDQVEVMQQLGHERFLVVGHDRGARVAHRMALDHAARVQRVALLDIVPTLHLYEHTNKSFASAYFHWFLLIQPAPLPETLLGNSAEFFLRGVFRGLDQSAMPAPVFDAYLRAVQNPATLHAMCEDYRASASIDLEHDRADLDQPVACPLLTLWAERGAMHPLYDVLATWRARARDVRGKALPGGHWLPEEIPDLLYNELLPFLSE